MFLNILKDTFACQTWGYLNRNCPNPPANDRPNPPNAPPGFLFQFIGTAAGAGPAALFCAEGLGANHPPELGSLPRPGQSRSGVPRHNLPERSAPGRGRFRTAG